MGRKETIEIENAEVFNNGIDCKNSLFMLKT